MLFACNHSPEEVKTQSSKVLGHARLHSELEILPETKSGVKKKEGGEKGKQRNCGREERKREGGKKGRAEAERRKERIGVREETKALGEK